MKLRYYIEDLIYGANDGIITTFAIVAGVIGAGLPSKTVLVIGLASLFADGFSMASSDYLARESEKEVVEEDGIKKAPAFLMKNPVLSAFLTFLAFTLLGFIPLIPYVFFGDTSAVFAYTMILTGASLFLVGALRALVTRRSFWRQGFEVLLIGGTAACIAYFVGQLVSTFI